MLSSLFAALLGTSINQVKIEILKTGADITAEIFSFIIRKALIYIIAVPVLYGVVSSILEYQKAKHLYEMDQYTMRNLGELPGATLIDSLQRVYELRETYIDSVYPIDYLNPEFLYTSDENRLELLVNMNVGDMLMRTARKDDPLARKMVRTALTATDLMQKDCDGERYLNTFYQTFIRLFKKQELLRTYENFNNCGYNFRGLQTCHKKRLNNRYDEVYPTILQRLKHLGIEEVSNSDVHHTSYNPPFQRYLIINQLGSIELIPKILKSQQLLDIYKTKDSKVLPLYLRIHLGNQLSYESDQPHILGYAATLAEKEKVAHTISMNAIAIPKDCRLVWGFAKERTGSKDANGNDLYGYALYVAGDRPNANGTGLCVNPIHRVTTFFDYDEDASVTSVIPNIKFSLRPELQQEWNYFTFKNSRQHFLLMTDNEVLYSPYIEESTDNLDIICQEKHRLRECSYLYALLQNDGYRYDVIENVKVVHGYFKALPVSYLSSYQQQLTCCLILLILYAVSVWVYTARKRYKEEVSC